MGNERPRVCRWTKEPRDVGWPIHWSGEAFSTQGDDRTEMNDEWCPGDNSNKPWHPGASSHDEIDGNWRRHRRTRAWSAKGPRKLSRGGRAKMRGRGRGEFVRLLTWGGDDAPRPSDPPHEVNHEETSAGGEVKQDSEEPSVLDMDGDWQHRREESNVEVLASGEHAEIESHARHLLRLVEQARRTFDSKEQEHRNLYKRARLDAESEHQQRRDLQQQLFSVCEENEKLTSEVATLQTEVASTRAEVDREKRSCLTWRERLMKHEGRIGKLQGEIEQLSGVRSENLNTMNELDSVRAHLQSEQSRSAQLQDRLTKLESTFKCLQESHDRTTHDLQEEKEKTLCQICMDRPRDTCSLPCVHLNYCSWCLLKHLETNKTCPACRTPTSGTLQTSLYTIT